MDDRKDENHVCEIMFDAYCAQCDIYILFYVEIELNTVVQESCDACGSSLVITNIMGLDVGQAFFNMLATLQTEVH